MGLHDCQRQAVVAVIAIPAVVHFLRAPVIQATVKQGTLPIVLQERKQKRVHRVQDPLQQQLLLHRHLH